MASNAPSSQDIMEAHIKSRIESWLSRAVPITMDEAIARQWHLEVVHPRPENTEAFLERLRAGENGMTYLEAALTADGDPNDDVDSDMVISADNPKGYLYVPGDSVPADAAFRKRQEALGGDITPATLQGAEALMDEEIETGGYLVFENSLRPLADMKTFEKVNLIAKYRLMTGALAPEEPEEAKQVAGGRKMYHLHVTDGERVGVRVFVEALDAGHKAFLKRLERISAPLRKATYMKYASFQTEPEGRLALPDLGALPQEEAQRRADEFVAGLTALPEYESWSYCLFDCKGDNARRLAGDWRVLDNPEDLEAMFEAMRSNGDLAPAFIRTCELWEAKYICLKIENAFDT